MLGRDRLRFLERVDRAADGFVPMLALRGELQLDQLRVAVAEHNDFRRAAGQVDRNVARHLELRLVHVVVAGADDLVDALDVGEPADRLRAADRPHLVERRAASAAAAISPAPAGGVQTTMRRTPAACAGTAHMTSVEIRLRGT